jgi:hypothetical protein
MWARSGLHGGEQETEEVEHSVSIADLRSRAVFAAPHRVSPTVCCRLELSHQVVM